jgi:hypothetical protein
MRNSKSGLFYLKDDFVVAPSQYVPASGVTEKRGVSNVEVEWVIFRKGSRSSPTYAKLQRDLKWEARPRLVHERHLESV